MVDWLHVDGRWVKDSINRVFRIAGAGDPVFTFTPEDGVPPYIFLEKLDLFKQAGANTYRLCVALDTYNNSEYALLVNQMIQWCKQRGIYVQLDAHAIAQGQGQGNPWLPIFDNPEPWYQFWEARARQYLNEPTVALFEICNEPLEDHTRAEQWRVMATTCVQRIHAINPNVICVVGDVSWNSTLATFEDNPIREPNVVYTIHRYLHYSDWTDWGAAYLNATTESQLQNAYLLMRDFFYTNGFDMLDKGYPVILGELGTWRNCPYYNRTADPNYLRQLDDELKMLDEWEAGFLQYAWIGYIKGYSVVHAMLTDDWSKLNEVGEQVWKVHLPLNTLIVTATIGGTTDPPPERYDYEEGTSAIVTAIPDASYRFDHWELDGTVRTENPITIVMDSDYSLRAVFKLISPPQYVLTIASTSGGTTSPTPGTYPYTEGSVVSIAAIPNSAYRFVNWTLDGATRTENPISVTMDQNHSATANFEVIQPILYTLSIATTTGGDTNPTPGSYTYNAGTTVSVVALPNTDYRFGHWILDGLTVTNNPISVTMTQNRTLTAYFAVLPPTQYILTIATTAGGTTDPSPSSYTIAEGQTQQVVALPSTNYRFVNWFLDGISRTENPITVTMNRDHSLTATFEYVEPPPTTATLTGTVKDAATASPIAGATVTCDGYADITEVDGSYAISNVPPKEYSISFAKEGYETQTVTIDASAGGTVKLDIALKIRVLVAGFPLWAIGAVLITIPVIYLVTRKGGK